VKPSPTKSRYFSRPKLGDVFEVALSKEDFGYIQYVYNYRKPPVWGPLIRILPGLYASRPENISDLVAQSERFWTFYPLATLLRQGLVTKVSNEAIPERCQTFPLFKACNRNFQTGQKTWFLWDGDKEWKVDPLSPEYYDLSLCQIIGHELLVERIETNWSPRDEV
jgi:hypothetical protein